MTFTITKEMGDKYVYHLKAKAEFQVNNMHMHIYWSSKLDLTTNYRIQMYN